MTRRHLATAGLGSALVAGLLLAAPVSTGAAPTTGPAGHGTPPASPATAYGSGGAVSSVDAEASRVGIEVLRRGGNAADAAVATASALGVTEPYSAGIGGGGYFVHYDARSGKVRTIDGRETAPRRITPDAFVDPETGEPYPFSPELVSSGVAVGVPGTVATWDRALERFGSLSLRQALEPSIRLARRGFTVDETFRDQTAQNEERFAAFPATADLFLPGGAPPRVGSRFRNPDLADTLQDVADRGTKAFYRGQLAREVARTVRMPRRTRPRTCPPRPAR